MTRQSDGRAAQPVPQVVVDAVAGRPMVGEWEVMIPMLTVDSDAYPHVCLLSRAELDADDEHVYAVLASPVTIENLRRSARATLLSVDADAATYTKLDLESTYQDGDWMLAVFTVAAVKRDSAGIPLRPPRFLVTDAIAVDEDWTRSTALLAAARARSGRRVG